MVDFAAQIQKQIDLAMKDMEKQVVVEFERVATNAYDNLLKNSPVWSGYYKSNHRIVLRNSKGQFKTGGTLKLLPQQKEEFPEVLKFIGNIEQARNEELSKLSKLELGDILTIATRVPYADEVEQKHRPYSQTEAGL